jgi:ATP-binding cassette subfamily F protein uup
VAKSLDREPTVDNSREAPAALKKKLSYLEAREYATLEQRIADAEEQLKTARAASEDPAIASDAERLIATHVQLEQAGQLVDRLYARWEELEAKIG